MLVHAHGFAINRGIADHVHVELDLRGGLPAFSVIGLGGGAARDARERVQAAILNSGYGFPRRRMTVNLAPAAAAGRSGPAFDLALACCVLAVQDEIDPARLARVGLFAELGLGGDLRRCDCVGAAAEAAEQADLAGLVVARGDLREARAAASVPVAALGSLREVAALLASGATSPTPRRAGWAATRAPHCSPQQVRSTPRPQPVITPPQPTASPASCGAAAPERPTPPAGRDGRAPTPPPPRRSAPASGNGGSLSRPHARPS
jgi:predicted ATPase with chaperone activity